MNKPLTSHIREGLIENYHDLKRLYESSISTDDKEYSFPWKEKNDIDISLVEIDSLFSELKFGTVSLCAATSSKDDLLSSIAYITICKVFCYLQYKSCSSRRYISATPLDKVPSSRWVKHQEEHPIYFLSLRHSTGAISMEMLSRWSNVPMGNFKEVRLTALEWTAVANAAGELVDSGVHLGYLPASLDIERILRDIPSSTQLLIIDSIDVLPIDKRDSLLILLKDYTARCNTPVLATCSLGFGMEIPYDLLDSVSLLSNEYDGGVLRLKSSVFEIENAVKELKH